MRTIVHLSDLHFGRIDLQLLEPLRRTVEELAPDLLVVSGDLTQRAKCEQFREARAYLDSIPIPRLVVPGNHDVPLYNVLKRFVSPLKNYRKCFSNELEPQYIDDQIAVVGVNTARSLVFKGGRINEEQIARVRAAFQGLPEKVTKIVVTHHPFDLPEGHDNDALVGRADLAMKQFAQIGADMLLAGHMHVSHAGNTENRYQISGYAALVVQAGTATSTRGRGESNSFNVIRSTDTAVEIQRLGWDDGEKAYLAQPAQRFDYAEGRWFEATPQVSPPAQAATAT